MPETTVASILVTNNVCEKYEDALSLIRSRRIKVNGQTLGKDIQGVPEDWNLLHGTSYRIIVTPLIGSGNKGEKTTCKGGKEFVVNI